MFCVFTCFKCLVEKSLANEQIAKGLLIVTTTLYGFNLVPNFLTLQYSAGAFTGVIANKDRLPAVNELWLNICLVILQAKQYTI